MLAVLSGVIAMAGIWVYLGPYPGTAFTVTAPPDAGSGSTRPMTWTIELPIGSSEEDLHQAIGPQPYTSIVGPFPTEFERSTDRMGAAIQMGILSTLFAYVVLYLLGFSMRFRRIEPWLAYAENAYWRRYGAATAAIARSLLLVAAGAAASLLVAFAIYWGFTATATSLGWLDWTYWTETRWAALAGLVFLLALIAVGVVGVIAVAVRRLGLRRGVGSFLVGYGGVLAGLWVQNIVSMWGSCGPGQQLLSSDTHTRVACFADTVGSAALSITISAPFCAIAAIGALLVYRGYRHRRAEAPLSHVAHVAA